MSLNIGCSVLCQFELCAKIRSQAVYKKQGRCVAQSLSGNQLKGEK